MNKKQRVKALHKRRKEPLCQRVMDNSNRNKRGSENAVKYNADIRSYTLTNGRRIERV